MLKSRCSSTIKTNDECDAHLQLKDQKVKIIWHYSANNVA